MKELKIKKELLKINDMILQDEVESLATKYKIPVEELRRVLIMSRINGRMEESLAMEEVLLNNLKETEKD